jgi:4-carboxymuconolactone decarboxylase
LLRRLALNDEATVESVLGQTVAVEHTNLGSKTTALARLAALVAIDASPSTFQWGIGAALAAGADEHDLVELLLTVAPIVGTARTSAAVPAFAGALGFDLQEPLPG